MATGANTTPLGRLNPSLNHKQSIGSSLLKPSYMSSSGQSGSQKRDYDEDYRMLSVESTNWPPEVPDHKKKKKRSRWGGDDKEKVFIPGMPTVLPTNLTSQQETAYLLQLQIEEISRRLRTGDLGIPPNPEDRSPSPEPIYNSEGKRLNTREYRTRKKLEDDRHALIQEMFQCNPDFKPPADYKPPMVKVSEKVMIPQEEHPDINFVGLLIGPRGNTLKAMEKETGAKIIIRGKGSVKEGKVGRKDGQPLPGEDEPLHAFVTANSPESVKKAVDKIKEIIRQGVEVPEGQNDLRRMQLRELALLNGTLREGDGPRCTNCGAATHRSWQCPDKPNVTNNVICGNCGGAGHIARDCRDQKTAGGNFAATDKSKIDEEYMSLMAELGEGPPPPTKAGTVTVNTSSGPSPLAGPQPPPRAVMAPPVTQQTFQSATVTAPPPPWNSTVPNKTVTMIRAGPPPGPIIAASNPTLLPPSGSTATSVTVSSVPQPQATVIPWQQPQLPQSAAPTAVVSATQPNGLSLHTVAPAQTLLAQPPPPPPPPLPASSQAQPPTVLPWMQAPQAIVSQAVTVTAGVPPLPWQQAMQFQQAAAGVPMPVPPPPPVTVIPPAFPWTAFMGLPPPPPTQPPLPPGLTIAPPPPPPPPPASLTTVQTVSTTTPTTQGPDLTALPLPNLLTAPPPPPPS